MTKSHFLTILIPLSYQNELPIFVNQLKRLSSLGRPEVNIIFVANDIGSSPPELQELDYVTVILSKDSRSKAQNLLIAISHPLCAEQIAVFDFNEHPAIDTKPLVLNENCVIQGAKIFLPEFDSKLSLFCFIESSFRYLLLLPMLLSIFKSPALILGSNFYCRKSDIEVMFCGNISISEDLHGSLILLSRGRQIKYDASRICLESAPRTARDWIAQRIKWSMGLTELYFKYRNLSHHFKFHTLLLTYIVATSLFIPVATIGIACFLVFFASVDNWLTLTAGWWAIKTAEAILAIRIARTRNLLPAGGPDNIWFWVAAAYPAYEAARLSVKSVGFCAFLAGHRDIKPTGRGRGISPDKIPHPGGRLDGE